MAKTVQPHPHAALQGGPVAPADPSPPEAAEGRPRGLSALQRAARRYARALHHHPSPSKAPVRDALADLSGLPEAEEARERHRTLLDLVGQVLRLEDAGRRAVADLLGDLAGGLSDADATGVHPILQLDEREPVTLFAYALMHDVPALAAVGVARGFSLGSVPKDSPIVFAARHGAHRCIREIRTVWCAIEKSELSKALRLSTSLWGACGLRTTTQVATISVYDSLVGIQKLWLEHPYVLRGMELRKNMRISVAGQITEIVETPAHDDDALLVRTIETFPQSGAAITPFYGRRRTVADDHLRAASSPWAPTPPPTGASRTPGF